MTANTTQDATGIPELSSPLVGSRVTGLLLLCTGIALLGSVAVTATSVTSFIATLVGVAVYVALLAILGWREARRALKSAVEVADPKMEPAANTRRRALLRLTAVLAFVIVLPVLFGNPELFGALALGFGAMILVIRLQYVRWQQSHDAQLLRRERKSTPEYYVAPRKLV
jgi:hypothetical protein